MSRITLRQAACLVPAWALALCLASPCLAARDVHTDRLKDLGRIEGWRTNQLVGYGLVTGLAGTGDSSRNRATRQSMANLLSRFELSIPADQILSRNVAVVMVTATLPPVAHVGDRLDVAVTSIGDARSLLGGVLLMTALKGPDEKVHALAQGPLSVGGYKYDLNGNLLQKNHPTTGLIPAGANIEVATGTPAPTAGALRYLLNEPDYTTANRAAQAINTEFGRSIARPMNGGTVELHLPVEYSAEQSVAFLTRLESLRITPDRRARVVVNERSGVVVAGGDVRIDPVTVTHGELKVSIQTDYLVSQPVLLRQPGPGIATAVVPRTRIDVQEDRPEAVQMASGTVSDLVRTLARMKVSPRDMIAVLQAIRAAGALRAELIIQ